MNPLKQIMNIRRDELPQALLMFCYFFLVITTFSVLKPLKSGLFIQFYDQSGFDLMGWHMLAAQAELLAKVLNMVIALVAATVFALLSRSFRRQQLTYVFSAFILSCFLFFTFVLDSPGAPTIWSFYLFGDLYSTLMVATFFAFLNDSVEPEAAKRLYGLIVLGGVAGGFFGATFAAVRVDDLSMVQWLWIFMGLAVAIVVIAGLAGKMFARKSLLQEPEPEEKPISAGSPLTEAARMVFRSRYLLSIVAIVGLYEMVSTTMDFQFKSTIAYYLDGPAISVHIATVQAISNGISFFIQIFLTSLVMRRFGVGTALLVLPVMALAGSVGFLFTPVLLTGSALYIFDNGFNNSINQSSKEVLYVPTTREEKYQAKAFIDMFVQRLAKAVAVGLSLAITTLFVGFGSVRWLSLVTALILVAWISIVRFAGKEFEKISGEPPGSDG